MYDGTAVSRQQYTVTSLAIKHLGLQVALDRVSLAGCQYQTANDVHRSLQV